MNPGGTGVGGPGPGSGPVQEMPGGGPSMHQHNVPHATEYTLQGVMRFLQTEWHRHERDRNSWEIERQEMKGRIAALEGAARRGDATQKALRRYVQILEKKIKDQTSQLEAANRVPGGPDHSVKRPSKLDRAALIQEKLKSTNDKLKNSLPRPEALLGIQGDDERDRDDLRNFLDQCQAEFSYLMMTPANPLPPRDSPPLPMMEEVREGEFALPHGQQPLDAAFQALRLNQNHGKDPASRLPPNANHHVPPMQQAGGVNMAPKVNELQSAPMVRSGESSAGGYPHPGDWSAPAATSNTRAQDDRSSKMNHVNELPRTENSQVSAERRAGEAEGWDFNEAAFPDPTSQPLQPFPQRPDTDVFPAAENPPKSPNRGPNSHRRKSSLSRRRSAEQEITLNALAQKMDGANFKLRYGLRGHLNAVRTVIFSGGGSPGEPEICTAGDDGLIKRFHIPRENPSHGTQPSDLDVPADFTHRGHTGAVLCLTSWSPSPNFSTGGRAQGDGWIFSGGQDATIRVWERGRVDPKATLDGHSDAVWAICVLPATLGTVFGQSNSYGTPDRILVASGAADGAIKIWAVSAPPQLTSPQPGPAGRRAAGSGRVRGNSMSSGSQFPSSPQPNMASNSPFHSTLVHDIRRSDGSKASPTCITPLSTTGEAFVVSFSDAAVIVFNTKTGEEISSMASLETYDNTVATSVNAVVATTASLEQGPNTGLGEEEAGGPTGSSGSSGSGIEGVIISGHEDQFIRFFDANSGQCTYNMLAHPAAISSLSLSPDGRELVSAGHDASLRFWSLEKRTCTQEITSHRIMRGEGVCAVVWSQDGRWVVSAGGDGLVKVFAR
ncbi:putative striatin pro11 [Rosellinia necatrix]|uniref:Putative striatin pro11 n=1 Tax=Rosellinia necatrix TaxID=77044 RepID=A0A1W2TK92_ROSNE|nr:putative striatin pro11 [Rosellinia necatrix]